MARSTRLTVDVNFTSDFIWNPSKHPRGHSGNKGQFASGGGGGGGGGGSSGGAAPAARAIKGNLHNGFANAVHKGQSVPIVMNPTPQHAAQAIRSGNGLLVLASPKGEVAMAPRGAAADPSEVAKMLAHNGVKNYEEFEHQVWHIVPEDKPGPNTHKLGGTPVRVTAEKMSLNAANNKANWPAGLQQMFGAG